MREDDVTQYIRQSRVELDAQGEVYPKPSNFQATYEVIEDINCAWVQAPEPSTKYVILYLHGGAYFQGSIKSHQFFVSQITHRCGINVLLPEYKLMPESPFPGGLDDVIKLYKYLLQESDYERIMLMGDSAGGGLALALINKLKILKLALPELYVGLFPWLDLSDESTVNSSYDDEEFVMLLTSLYSGKEDKANPSISPFFCELDGFPSMLIQVGTKDPLVSQCRNFAKKARLSGNEIEIEVYEQMDHGWHFFNPNLPETDQAFDNIDKFVKKHID